MRQMKNKKAIKGIWQDDDGWWATLKPEYGWGVDDNHVVNGETWEQLCEAMKDVHKIK